MGDQLLLKSQQKRKIPAQLSTGKSGLWVCAPTPSTGGGGSSILHGNGGTSFTFQGDFDLIRVA